MVHGQWVTDPFCVLGYCAGPPNSDGKLSHFAHFENCTFTGNRGKEFGAAMGFTFSFLAFQSMENIKPFEIESW